MQTIAVGDLACLSVMRFCCANMAEWNEVQLWMETLVLDGVFPKDTMQLCQISSAGNLYFVASLIVWREIEIEIIRYFMRRVIR